MTDRGEDEDRRLPVTVLTGFLGAGKTTILNQLVQLPEMAGCAVLINELGAVAVDHHLVERIDETLVVLDSGCICCSVQGDLVRALKGLFMRALRREIGPLRRVLIETTGLADPAPVIHTLMAEPFISERFRCDGVITAVDASHAMAQLDEHREAVRQVAMADRLLITKCDLADAPLLAALCQRLRALNPGAQQLEVSGGVVAADAILGCGLYDPAGKTPDVSAWLGEQAVRMQAARNSTQWRRAAAPPAAARPAAAHSRHDADVSSFVLVFDEPLRWFDFSDALDVLLQAYGTRILRIKGLLNIAGDPLPRVLQCVQHSVYPPTSLPAWPGQPPYDDRRSRLVFIVRDLAQAQVESILASIGGQAPAA